MEKDETRVVWGDFVTSDEEFFGDNGEYRYLGFFKDGIARLHIEDTSLNDKPVVDIVYPTLEEVMADEKMLREVSAWCCGREITYYDVALLYGEVKKD